MTDTVFVLNGPNLNLLGTREPRIYGTQTLDDIGAMMEQRAKALKLRLDIRQSNHEGMLVDWLQEALAKASAVILNAGGYAHSSIAIRDAAAALPIPVIEVHLTNIYAREGFRRTSLVGQVARGSIVGFGALGYVLALDAAAHLCKGAAATQAKSQIQ
ncbi:MAG: type II 3-dehydroquinate dehydratase [Sphingomicrobium sp.]